MLRKYYFCLDILSFKNIYVFLPLYLRGIWNIKEGCYCFLEHKIDSLMNNSRNLVSWGIDKKLNTNYIGEECNKQVFNLIINWPWTLIFLSIYSFTLYFLSSDGAIKCIIKLVWTNLFSWHKKFWNVQIQQITLYLNPIWLYSNI